MRSLVFLEAGRLEWQEAEDARLGADAEAIVRPVAVATCDLDTAVVAGVTPFQGPFAFGHECVAEVTDVGDAVTGFSPGDLVSVPFQIGCGECENCRRGHTGNCTSVERMSMYGLPLGADYGGFLSDSVRVPFADAMLVPVPQGVTPAAIASLSDNVPDAWRTVAPQLEAAPGSPILICAGAGSIALYAAAIALALGAERVDWVGGRAAERELAASLGANLLDEDFPERLGPYRITVDASGGRPEGLACALRSTEPEGTCTSIGIYYQGNVEVPLLEMYTKGIDFHTGRVHARPAMPEVLELVRDGRFAPEQMTAQTIAWDDAEAALSELRVKTVIERG